MEEATVARQAPVRRNSSEPRGHHWLSLICAVAIGVVLVVFGARIAQGPAANADAAASSGKPPATKPAAVTSGTPATPATTAVSTTPGATATSQTVQATSTQVASALGAQTPLATASADVSSATVGPNTDAAITEGISPVATTAFQAFIARNSAVLDLGQSTSPAFTQASTGVSGQYFSNAVLEYHPELANTPYAVELTRVGVAIAGTRNLLQTPAFQPLPEDTTSDSDCTFMAVTLHRLCGGFRAYWQSNGLDLGDSGTSFRESLALLGYPISEEFTDPTSGKTVQYFERGILEYDPTQPPANRVKDVSPTDAVLTRWHYQIVAGVDHVPGGG